MRQLSNLLVTLALAATAAAQAPSGYYDSVDTTSSQTLRVSLHELIDDHQRFPYTSTATDTWNILEVADQDPNDASRILDVYKNASYAKFGAGNTFYNREHSWPTSYGFPNDNSSNYPYTDCHHLFLSDSSYNSSRSNKPFKDSSAAATEKPTEFNNGVGGGSGFYPGNSNWTSGSGATGEWQTWSDRRGDVARALLYMDLRYEGGAHSVTGVSEPDLILTDDVALIAASNTGANESVAYMGHLSTLLSWHAADPVDAKERARNEAVFAFQGNRNPFIDHPEWATCIFTGSCDGGTVGGGGGGGDTGGGSNAWINELHYDNSGTDTLEGVEVAGNVGLDLSGWSLVAYNGNGGGAYATVNLSGAIADQSNGFGTVWFPIAGLQNGAPDGIALVDGSGQLVQFLSYEGTLTATDGPAAGTSSTDIGVAETSSTPVGWSLQLTGDGSSAADFTWSGPSPGTSGQPNAGQSFSGGGPPPDTTPPAAPTGLLAVAGTGEVQLDWNANAEPDLDGYVLERSTSFGGPFAALHGAVLEQTSYLDIDVANGTTYFYRLSAVDLSGNSSATGPVVDATPEAPTAPSVWINEFHYDDKGSDNDEGVELAGPAGTNLSGWSIVLYDGSSGSPYATIAASGTIPNQQGGYGAVWFGQSGIQNGSPDGMALVAPDGGVVEFLSYEGTLMGSAGPASGSTSIDVGVSETSGTPNGRSLQRVGSGTGGADFIWSGPARHSRGEPNADQSFGG